MSWGALPSSGLPSCKQRIAGWLFFFLFFPETFPMVRFEPGTFHSASECLNHSAIPETVQLYLVDSKDHRHIVIGLMQ